MRKINAEDSLMAKYPIIAAEWDYEKNAPLTPQEIFPGCNKNVWWKCLKCGNEWRTTVNSRSSGTGCHICNRIYGKMSHKCKNIDTGEIFATLKEAAVAYGIKGTTGISLCCSGKQKTAGEYHWQYI